MAPSDSRPSDPRPSDPRPSDPRPSDPRPSDPRPSDSGAHDPGANDAGPNTAPPAPRPAGLAPTFRHLDDLDLPWQAVKSQRNADGSESHVWEKWLAFSPEPQYLSLYAKYDPGMIVRRHGHFSPHIVFILEGDATFGDQHCPTGTHIELPFGAAFGPVIAGANGAVMFEVMLGDPRSWGDQPKLFEAALRARGVTALPDPPLDFPEWLQDLRAHWAPTSQ